MDIVIRYDAYPNNNKHDDVVDSAAELVEPLHCSPESECLWLCDTFFFFLIQKTTTTMTRDSRGILSRIENWVYWKWGELKLSRRQTKDTNTHTRVSSMEPQGEAIFKLILSIFGGRKVCFFIADNSNAISSFERARSGEKREDSETVKKNSRFRLKVIKSVSPANMINSFS